MLPTDPQVWLVFDGTLPIDNPNLLSIAVEANSTTVGLTQTVDMFNFVSGQYEQVDSRAAMFNSDSVVTVDLMPDIQQYIQPGSGAIRTRVGWKRTGFVLLFPWTISIDQVVWSVTQ